MKRMKDAEESYKIANENYYKMLDEDQILEAMIMSFEEEKT